MATKCAYYADLNIGVKRRVKRICGGKPHGPVLGPYDTAADARKGLERYRKGLERRYKRR